MQDQVTLNVNELGELIATAKQLAKRYRALTGRPIGFTGAFLRRKAAQEKVQYRRGPEDGDSSTNA